MPMGIVSDEELEAELAKLNGKTVVVIQPPDVGRSKGDRNVPSGIRKIISEEAITGSKPEILGEIFDVSPSSISAYKNGATSTASYHEPNPELKSNNKSVRDRVTRRASKKLILALDNITEEKLADCKVRDAAGIARDMSQIIKNMEPDEKEDNRVQNNIVFYAPRLKDESDFEAIQLSDL